ncbi:MAG: pyrimidine operon attenuation protein/uracil phosphoribosyltransferase [Saprospiraceae bacterium]
MKILDERQIKQKIKRLAIQILEKNLKEGEIILAGINNNGMGFAKMIYKELNKISENKITLTRIRLSPANPLESEVTIEMPLDDIANKVIIIVDDVANTGRTIFYAMKPLMNILPKKVQVAVLVDRKHKSFPIEVDYVGLSLATTMRESIDVQILKVPEKAVFLN